MDMDEPMAYSCERLRSKFDQGMDELLAQRSLGGGRLYEGVISITAVFTVKPQKSRVTVPYTVQAIALDLQQYNINVTIGFKRYIFTQI
jgi:hypothetical protein